MKRNNYKPPLFSPKILRTYYVYIDTGDFHDDGQYGLTVTTSTGSVSNVETEDNGTFINADILNAGVKKTGQLSTSGDLDVF